MTLSLSLSLSLSLIPDHKNLPMIFYRVPISGQRLDALFTYLISQVLHRIVVVISNRCLFHLIFSLILVNVMYL